MIMVIKIKERNSFKNCRNFEYSRRKVYAIYGEINFLPEPGLRFLTGHESFKEYLSKFGIFLIVYIFW